MTLGELQRAGLRGAAGTWAGIAWLQWLVVPQLPARKGWCGQFLPRPAHGLWLHNRRARAHGKAFHFLLCGSTDPAWQCPAGTGH